MLNPANAVIACKSAQNGATCNNAVARCCAAFIETFRAVFAAGDPNEPNSARFEAGKAAVTAYSAALPPLTGASNIRDFIACVAHGMLLEILDDRAGTKLLYAAQVAGSFMEKPAKAEPSALRTPKSTAA
jgi:hypothetical protein